MVAKANPKLNLKTTVRSTPQVESRLAGAYAAAKAALDNRLEELLVAEAGSTQAYPNPNDIHAYTGGGPARGRICGGQGRSAGRPPGGAAVCRCGGGRRRAAAGRCARCGPGAGQLPGALLVLNRVLKTHMWPWNWPSAWSPAYPPRHHPWTWGGGWGRGSAGCCQAACVGWPNSCTASDTWPCRRRVPGF